MNSQIAHGLPVEPFVGEFSSKMQKKLGKRTDFPIAPRERMAQAQCRIAWNLTLSTDHGQGAARSCLASVLKLAQRIGADLAQRGAAAPPGGGAA